MIITNIDQLRRGSIACAPGETKAKEVFEKLDEALTQSIVPGVGLAAIQIGIPLRACIIKYKDLNLKMENPVILEKYDPFIFPQEGCLSLPNIHVDTERYREIFVEWIDPDTGKDREATFLNEEACIVLHETDHMDGVLILDRKKKKQEKIGRNDPCSCNSGRKYKKCCGR